VLLGDLHFDKLGHHDLAWLEKDKPDDLRQVRDYTRLTTEILPKLVATVRKTIAELRPSPEPRVACAVQVGDFVEGLCGSEALAVQQDTDAVEFVRGARLGAPLLFTKGNHDITGDGAANAFKTVFHPFLAEQAAVLDADRKLAAACYALQSGDALFCFFDAYDKESLSWLDRLSSEAGHRVMCAAHFKKHPCRLLEAQLTRLYRKMPVPEGWHEAYARGETDTSGYSDSVCVEDTA